MSPIGKAWGFLKDRRKWWLGPVIFTAAVIGALLLFRAGSSAPVFAYGPF
ncbi:MAG: hypothetical protein FJ087_01150 [Deltaproteobacteria bacterium]|nr:hypothetical protein [Deltaproteobacteria bacterium]